MQKKVFYIVTTQIGQEKPFARWWESQMNIQENNKIFESFEEGLLYMRNEIKEVVLNCEEFPLNGNRYEPIYEFYNPRLDELEDIDELNDVDELNDIIVKHILNPAYNFSGFKAWDTDESERRYAFVANKDIVLVDYDNTRLSFNIHKVKDPNNTYFFEYVRYDKNGSAIAKLSFKLTNTLEKKLDKSVKKLANGRKIIAFGNYKQTAKGDYKTPIEWQVLEVKHQRVTLIADKCLDVFAFDEKGSNEWGENTLFQWLKTEFINEAFTAEEQKRLVDGFPITILPKHGVEAFYRKEKDRFCEYTDYVKEKYEKIVGKAMEGSYIAWWTKTENGKENVFRVCNNGEIDGNGQPRRLAGVRPVIFLKID